LLHRQSETLYEDAMIAAIPKVHHHTVVRRNVADFSRFEVTLLHPSQAPRRPPTRVLRQGG
jgi:predicted nucleic acid-binding protein